MSAPACSRSAVRALLLAVVLAACAPTPGRSAGGDVAADAPVDAAARDTTERPLAQLVGRPALLFPVQQVSGVPGVEPAALDAEIAFALDERRAAGAWTAANALRRLARTSAAYASDPAALALPVSPLRSGEEVHDPLASQLRALAALTDARIVVVPTRLRADSTGAMLHVALVDVRGSSVLWAGETTAAPLLPAAGLAARVAERFADLAAAPIQH